MESLQAHFDLSDDRTDPGDWALILPSMMVEGTLVEDSPGPPPRWRRVGIDPERPEFGERYEIQASVKGERARIRLPFQMARLPWDGDHIYGLAAVDDEGNGCTTWYERVDGAIHYVIQRGWVPRG